MSSVTKKLFVSAIVLILPLAFAFSSGEQEQSSEQQSDESTETTQSEEPAPEDATSTVRFAEVGWLDIEATTATTRVVLEAMGYETSSDTVSVPVAYEGMAADDADIFLGYWHPSMASIAEPHFEEGTVENVGVNLEGAKYTLAVPDFLAEQGLTSFGDIADFAEELEYKIHGIEAGNDGNQLIQKMIDEDAFGLGEFEVVDSSEAGMLSEVKSRAPREEPIVFLGWEPHPMNTNLDMTYLEGGDDYFGPDYGAATVYTNARDGYLSENPNLARFFDQLQFTLTMENEIMSAISEGADARDAATEWLRENPEPLSEWLDGVTTYEGEPAEPAVREALDI
ncbi:MAG: choline ABC transporter substrate-binding protein [Spirochaetota bacterium]